MKWNQTASICLALLLCACSNKDNPIMPSQADWSAVRAKLAFSCVHEADHLSPLDPQADAFFKYGLFLEKKPGPKDYDAAARYYRIAVAYGHYKANHNLQLLVSEGFAQSPHAATETIDLVEQLIAAGIPGGYYDMGHYLELGYGVKKDGKKELVYFRKAADLGSPEAQAYVGKILEPQDRAPEIARQMRQCATDQGNHEAANELGIDLKADKRYADAVQVFQKGVTAGDTLSAFALQHGFNSKQSDAVYYLNLANDPERSRRYELIGKFLDDHESLNPRVPDIDQIVPLPPAKLPPWDGTFQWQKEQDAVTPPPKPPESLIAKLAREKNLDPATGLPLKPVKSTQAGQVPLGTEARTGEVCPQDGTWSIPWIALATPEATCYVRKGEVMPHLSFLGSRGIPFVDALLGRPRHTRAETWTLVSYERVTR